MRVGCGWTQIHPWVTCDEPYLQIPHDWLFPYSLPHVQICHGLSFHPHLLQIHHSLLIPPDVQISILSHVQIHHGLLIPPHLQIHHSFSFPPHVQIRRGFLFPPQE